MLLLMLASLLPAAMAAFDQCGRPTAEWVGFDQGHGASAGYAVAYSNGNLYVGGESKGSLSFGSKHTDGTYSDHEGTGATHDTHTDVTIHHETGSFVATGGSSNGDAASSQLGQDATVYKISEAGVPLKVFGADTLASDGSTDGTSENGKYGGWSYFYGLDAFDAEPDVVAGVGMYRGALKFPMADNSDKTLLNQKYMSKDGFVAKIDMTTGKAVWATDDGMKIDVGVAKDDSPKQIYGRDVATTGAGHVVAVSDIRSPYVGLITKHNGADGANLWAAQFPEIYNMYNVEVVGDEMAYVTGKFECKADCNAAWMPGAPTASVCDGGEDASAFIAAFDVSPDTTGPVAKWMTQVGCGAGYSVKVVGNFLYVAGRLSAEATIGTCAPLTGTQGGYLAKLNKADGTCVWAKDTPRIRRAISDGTHVWTYESTSGKMMFDADHTLFGSSGNDQLIAKYDASDGTGLWAEVFGQGDTSDYAYDAVATPTGPVFLGRSNSETNAVGDLAITNLQKQRVDADTTSTLSLQSGFTLTKLSSVETPHSCITSCPSGQLTDATIAANFCYIEGKCIAHDAPSPRLVCFKCDATNDQRNLPATPDTTNHCYFDDTCHAAGANRPAYRNYNTHSVCEVCQPQVDSSDWSAAPGYFQDYTFAQRHDCGWTSTSRGGFDGQPGPCAPNNYGILFTRNTNGCQVLPEVSMPATKTDNLKTALLTPSSGSLAAVGERASNAISAAKTTTSAADTALVAAWYSGDVATCTKVTISGVDGDKSTAGPCQNTPATHADEMAAAFGTNMHYGHSVARIKVQQALAILDDDIKTGQTTAAKSDMQKDIVAHMLIPMYQGAIKAAYDMDNGGKAAARDAGLTYWNLIHPNVPGFDAADKARLVALFGPSASGANNNYCQVKAILHRNLPDGSMLQYGQKDHTWIGSRRHSDPAMRPPTHHPSGLPTASAQHAAHKYAADDPDAPGVPGSTHGLVADMANSPYCYKGDCNTPTEGQVQDAVEAVHLQERDIGVLKAAGSSAVCVMPPPAPPPPTPATPTEVQQSSDSSLTDGEIAGVAIGATVGGIVLLGAVGLILRSIMFKEAKPVFTCLEKAPAKSPA
jgi:hypothetical protein